MSAPFFITGFPRSRTLWLSHLLTWDTHRCLHEYSRFVCNGNPFKVDANALVHTLEVMSTGKRCAGNSDATMLFHWREIVNRSPKSPWLLVQRDPDEVRDSLRSIGLGDGAIVVDAMMSDMDSFEKSNIPLVVDFDDIDERIGEIITHLAPGLYIPEWRIRTLIGASISCTEAHVKSLVDGGV